MLLSLDNVKTLVIALQETGARLTVNGCGGAWKVKTSDLDTAFKMVDENTTVWVNKGMRTESRVAYLSTVSATISKRCRVTVRIDTAWRMVPGRKNGFYAPVRMTAKLVVWSDFTKSFRDLKHGNEDTYRCDDSSDLPQLIQWVRGVLDRTRPVGNPFTLHSFKPDSLYTVVNARFSKWCSVDWSTGKVLSCKPLLDSGRLNNGSADLCVFGDVSVQDRRMAITRLISLIYDPAHETWTPAYSARDDNRVFLTVAPVEKNRFHETLLDLELDTDSLPALSRAIASSTADLSISLQR